MPAREKTRLRIFFILFMGVLGAGTFGFMTLEGLSVADAFYFTVVTIATVGYGDIHPASPAGKILAVFLIIVGVGSLSGMLAGATEMMLNRRDRQQRLAKLHMVMGVFFSQMGTALLNYFGEADPGAGTLRDELLVREAWTEDDFRRIERRLEHYAYAIDERTVKIRDLRNLLDQRHDTLLRLLENPTLHEQEAFSELIQAVSHLAEELLHRSDLDRLPSTDRNHLVGDMSRVYALLTPQWLAYMRYLKDNYPYLFSLAMRTNPFDRQASPVVR